ncbi:hypothetical protein H3C61_03680 [Candidatus Gracilibacteria bacterium]|nr:hypothetical protein [Candidatus Gracilibacteria bacterium]
MIVLNNHTTVHEMQDSFKNDTMFSLVNKTQSNFNGVTYTKDNFLINDNPWGLDRECIGGALGCEIYSYKAIGFNQNRNGVVFKIGLMTDDVTGLNHPGSVEGFGLKGRSDGTRNIGSGRNPWYDNISGNPYFSSGAIYVK